MFDCYVILIGWPNHLDHGCLPNSGRKLTFENKKESPWKKLDGRSQKVSGLNCQEHHYASNYGAIS